MTDPRGVHSGHLDAATIAALVDRTLDPAARAAAEAHLAACADCREVWVETSEVVSEPVKRRASPSSRSRTWTISVASVAAVAIFGVWLAQFGSRSEATVLAEQFARAMGPTRTTVGRLSGPFEWAPRPDPLRGDSQGPLPLEARTIAVRLEGLADDATAENLAAFGQVQLALGHVDSALDLLERSLTLNPNQVDVQADLAAAHLERWHATGAQHSALRALDASELALALAPGHPSAMFNKALALQALQLDEAASSAWEAFLLLDATSDWATEAREYLGMLEVKGEQASRRPVRVSPYSDVDAAIFNWARRTLIGESTDLAPALASAKSLADRGLDRRPLRLLNTLGEAGRWQHRRRACLARGLSALREWQDAYEIADLTANVRASAEAQAAFACAEIVAPELQLAGALEALTLGQYAQAIAALKSIAADASENGYLRLEARAHQAMGIALLSAAKLGDGLQRHRDGLEAAQKAADEELAAASYTYLGAVLEEHGDTERAWSCLAEAFARLPHVQSLRRRYLVLANAAAVAAEKSYYGATISLSRELLRQTSRWKNRTGMAMAHLGLARAYGALKLEQAAENELAAAERMMTGIGDAGVRKELAAEIAIAFGRLLESRRPSVAAEKFSEGLRILGERSNHYRTADLLLARGRAHRNAGRVDLAEMDWLRGIDLIEAQAPGITDAQLRSSRAADVWDLFDETVGLRRGDSVAALQLVERGRARELALAIDATEDSVDLHRLQWIPGHVRILMFASLPDRLLVWDLTSRGIRKFWDRPLPRVDLERTVRRHLERIRSGNAAQALAELSDALLPDDWTTEDEQVIVVVPDSALHLVPFAALPAPWSSSPLVESHDIAFAPSLRVLRATLRHDLGKVRSAVLIEAGDGDPAVGIPPLPGAAAEIRALSGVYPDARVFSGPDALWSAVRDDLATADVVHFAGHAIGDLDRPSRSRLLFSGSAAERSVTFEQLRDVNLRPGALIVLAGCSTAGGRVFRGEGVQALTRPLLERSAGAVVATLWPIRDSQSASLMIRFHQLLRDGHTPVSALAQAQRMSRGRGDAPSVWAAFTVTGLHKQETLDEPHH